MPRAFLVILDGLGCGEAHDAATYGDVGSNTLGNVLRAVGGLDLPVLQQLGLGNCGDFAGVPPTENPTAACGVCEPASAGKDSTTGHWELCGVTLAKPFPTFPNGFPAELIAAFEARTGRRVIGNVASSGTGILDALGERHMTTGEWIVYTSADSVFQVAAHESVVPLDELYAACAIARELCVAPYNVSRVIARPFTGTRGHWVRTAARKDLSVLPPGRTLVDALAERGIPRLGIGKVDDLFAGRNLVSTHTATNDDAYQLLGDALDTFGSGFCFCNVIEFDQSWGHRNDVPGFAAGLVALDAALGRLLPRVRPDDLVILTADHGNDPTTPSTDHARERVPLLVIGPTIMPVPLGVRGTFADVGQTIADLFRVPPLAVGVSFLHEVRGAR